MIQIALYYLLAISVAPQDKALEVQNTCAFKLWKKTTKQHLAMTTEQVYAAIALHSMPDKTE